MAESSKVFYDFFWVKIVVKRNDELGFTRKRSQGENIK